MNLHHYTKSYWHLCMLTSTPWCIVERECLPEVNQCRGQNENHLVFSHPDEPNKVQQLSMALYYYYWMLGGAIPGCRQ